MVRSPFLGLEEVETFACSEVAAIVAADERGESQDRDK